MAEQKTSISQLTAATAVTSSDLLLVSQGSGASWTSKKAAVGQLPFTTSADLANGAYSNIVANDAIGVRTNNFGPYMGINPTFVEQGLSIGSYVSLTHPVNTSNETWIFDQGVWTYEHPESADPGNEVIARWPSKSGRIAVDADLTSFLTAHQPVSASYVNQHIKLSANNALVGDIDCSNFIKDGMLSGVDLCSNQLIFKFNTDSGKTAVSVHLSNFIDKNNYYTKSELTSSTGVLTGYSLTSHTHSNYLTAVPTTYKTYANTKTALSGDGYVTGVKVNSTTKIPSSGVVDIGTVLTAHQSLSDYYTKPDIDSVFDYLDIKCCSPETVAILNDGTIYRINIVGEINQQTLNTYPMLTSAKTIVFGTNVTSIAAELYRNNSYIREIIAPTSVSSVGENAFIGSTLSSVIAVGWDHLSAIRTFERTVTIPNSCALSEQNIAFKEWVNRIFETRLVAGYALTADVTPELISSAIDLQNYVPTSRKVAGLQLTADITVAKLSTAIDLGSYSLTSHVHGNVTSDGKLQTTDVAIASGDKLVVTDSSNSDKIARSSLSFDGSTTNQFLTKKGTWGSALTAHQSLAAYYTKSDLTGSSGVLNRYSLTSHTHSDYSLTSHDHDNTYLKPGNSASHYMATLTALSSNDVTPASDTGKSFVTQAADSGHFGGMQVNVYASGMVRNRLFARKKIDGSNIDTALYLQVNADKSRAAELTFSPGYSSNNHHIATTSWVKTIKSYGMSYVNISPDGIMSNYAINRAVVGGTPTSNKVRYYIPKQNSGYSRHFYLSFNNNVSNTATLSVYVQSQSGENNTLWATTDLTTMIGSGPITVAKGANRVFEFVEFANGAFLIDVQVANNKTAQLSAY